VDSQDTQKKKGTGCLKLFIIVVCAIFFFISIVGYLLYKNMGSIGKDIGAKMVESAGQQIIMQSDLEDSQKKELLEPFTLFAEDIRAGKVNVEQAVEIMEEVANGPTWALITVSSIIIPRVQLSDLSPDEKKNLDLQLRRLGEGVRRGVVSVGVVRETLGEIFPEIDPDEDSGAKIRAANNEQLLELAKRVTEVVDKAGIEKKKFDFNIGLDLSRFIKDKIEDNRSRVE